MDTIYKSKYVTITGRRPDTLLGFLFIMLREAIEPIILALGVSLLYSRIQTIWETSQQTNQGWLSVTISDSEAHSVIYFLVAVVFVAWVLYKSWKMRGDKIRDRALSDALTGIYNELKGLRADIKESKKNDR